MSGWYKRILLPWATLLIAASNVTPVSAPAVTGQKGEPEAILIAQSGESSQSRSAGALRKNPLGYTDISVAELSRMMEGKDFLLVNVHVPYEGELPRTDLIIPFDRIGDEESLKKLPEKDAPIVLYCRSGSMSTKAAETLVELGYTDILELDGGFNAWKAADLPLLNKK